MSVPSAEQRLNGGTAVEKLLEKILVGARWIIVVPVLALLVGAGYFAFLSVYDVILGITSKDPAEGVSDILEAVDAGLLCAIFIIVSLGLYELFISRLKRADDKPLAHALEVGDLDGLKDKLGKAILLVLIIRFFDFVSSIELAPPNCAGAARHPQRRSADRQSRVVVASLSRRRQPFTMGNGGGARA